MGYIEKTLHIEIGSKIIPFKLGYDYLEQILSEIKNMDYDNLFVITDDNIAALYLESFKNIYDDRRPLHFIIIQAGELQKNFNNIEYAAQLALEDGISRKSIFVAFGGGVIGNLTGMISSLLFRGLRFIHIPTTLLAMHDSVTSQKQAINFGNSKNILGLFFTPEAIFCDVSFISTISRIHLHSGMAELIKNALIFGDEYRNVLEHILPNLESLKTKDLLKLVELGAQCKIEILKDDPFEKNYGLVFEYGHTVGHALELLLEGELSHGEAVAWGMLTSANISSKMGYLNEKGLAIHYKLINSIQVTVPSEFPSIEDVLSYVAYDNKKGHLDLVNNDYVQMVLLSDVGEVVKNQNKPLVNVPKNIIVEAYTDLVKSVAGIKTY